MTAGISRAMAKAAIRNAEDFADYFHANESAFADLIAEVTVGESYFHREAGQLEFVQREVFPELRRKRGDREAIRSWSAGCSTGEEPYSLAMLARDVMPPSAIRILATDVAERRLAIAAKAVYGEWSLRGVDPTIVERYFRRIGGRVQVIPEIRDMVVFRQLNLGMSDWSRSGIGPRSMDIILCRNVMIYMNSATIARVAKRLIESLSPDGWLILGASDPALSELVECDVIVTGAGLAYRRKARRSVVPTPAFAKLDRVEPKTPSSRERTETPAPAPREVQPVAKYPGALEKFASDLLTRTKSLHAAGEYALAADSARKCVTLDGCPSEAWVLLVRSLANLGANEEAFMACTAALDIERTSAELTYLHGLLLRQSSRNIEAAAAQRCAIYLDRNFIVAHLALGDVLAAIGDMDGALLAFRNAERLLHRMPASEVVPGSDGVTAATLLGIAQMQLKLHSRRRSA